jgi:hypothetical protein
MTDVLKELAAKIPDNSNWREAFTRSGQPAGFSFFCPTCRLHIPYNAGEGESGGVFHCGHLEKRPAIAGGSAEHQKAERAHRVRFI